MHGLLSLPGPGPNNSIVFRRSVPSQHRYSHWCAYAVSETKRRTRTISSGAIVEPIACRNPWLRPVLAQIVIGTLGSRNR